MITALECLERPQTVVASVELETVKMRILINHTNSELPAQPVVVSCKSLAFILFCR